MSITASVTRSDLSLVCLIVVTQSLFLKIRYYVEKQKFLEMLSWQGGGGSRLAFPPYKPTKGEDINQEKEEILSEMLEQLNILQNICPPEVHRLLVLFYQC